LSEAPIITFVRGITLLAFLTVLPGIAVCWNHLPKDLWSESAPSPVATDIDESASIFTQESINPALPPDAASPKVQVVEAPQLQSSPVPSMVAQQVSWEPPRAESPQNFESLKLRLQTLGATSYSLQKWGNRGELFRFSCLVAPSEPHTYEKYFQFIGTDAVTVIKTVIADIEQWKHAQ